jgi:hypothetical protein
MTPDDIASTWFDTGQPARTPVNPMLAFGGQNARIRVIPVLRKKNQSDPNGLYVFCCIRGDENERTLSPMYLGPCRLYGNFTERKMENAWQYSKVYPQHFSSAARRTFQPPFTRGTEPDGGHWRCDQGPDWQWIVAVARRFGGGHRRGVAPFV